MSNILLAAVYAALVAGAPVPQAISGYGILPTPGAGGEGGLPFPVPTPGSGGSGFGGLGGGLGGLGSIPTPTAGGLGGGLPFPIPTPGAGGSGLGDLSSLLGGLTGGLSIPTPAAGGSGSGLGGLGSFGGLGSGVIPTGTSGSYGDVEKRQLSGLSGLGGLGSFSGLGALPTGLSLPTPGASSGLGSLGSSSGLGSLGSLGGSSSSGSSIPDLGSLTGGSSLTGRQASDTSGLSTLLGGLSGGSSSGSSSSGSSVLSGLSLGGESTSNGLDEDCKAATLIFARGTTETGNMGSVVGPGFGSSLKEQLGDGKVAIQGVDYAADAAGIATEVTGGAGTTAMVADVQKAIQKCPDTQIILSGYSQGAMLVHNTMNKLTADQAKSVKAAVTFGDPFKTQALKNIDASAFRTFCASGDAVCGGGSTSGSAGSASTSGHLGYGADADTAAQFVKTKVTV
ncbi:carbohydrate esterase family 5 protein [Diplodia corticola]|uniref:Cutinase n=1 Tax=Diplodia corticola TaxID=236234 RepID=A0A1J9S341_9PEZI|nr:carbohydrate esterase family 5 protein [Diplodia corticola]OJD34420.1 carbohydrate esterase family 5 protein [Diplodia corticola]